MPVSNCTFFIAFILFFPIIILILSLNENISYPEIFYFEPLEVAASVLSKMADEKGDKVMAFVILPPFKS